MSHINEVDREQIGLALEEEYRIDFPRYYNPKNLGEVVDYIIKNKQ